jgi:methyl-accepting chemotaxis protein
MADNNDKPTTKTRAKATPRRTARATASKSDQADAAAKLQAHTTKGAMFDAFSRSMAMIEFTVDGTILWANDNFLNTIGYTLDEIRGRHHSLFVDPEYRSSSDYRDFWYELGQGIFKVARFKRYGKGGREVYLQAAYSPVIDEKGTIVKVVKLAADITADAMREIRAQEREDAVQAQQAEDKHILEEKVNALSIHVEAASRGDLTQQVDVQGDDDMGRLGSSLRKMICDLRTLIGEVMAAAQQQNEGARTIAESSSNLSEGAQTQAASVEEMTASVAQMIDSMQVISDNASSAKSKAIETAKLAKGGGTTVDEAVNAMKMIQKSSEQINEIIQVISEIASQTNLLAERSSEAAKEITKLIKESSRRVEEGASLSKKVGESLTKIVESVEDTAEGIGQIAASTEAQSASAQEVKVAIRSVSHTTESNAAASEEMAASAEQLGAQAQSLRDLVAKFKV